MSDKHDNIDDQMPPPRPPRQPDLRMIGYMEEGEKRRLRRMAKQPPIPAIELPPPRPPRQPDLRMIGYMEEGEKRRLRRLAKEVRKRERQEAKQRRLAARSTPG